MRARDRARDAFWRSIESALDRLLEAEIAGQARKVEDELALLAGAAAEVPRDS